jgi:hypothetical protein
LPTNQAIRQMVGGLTATNTALGPLLIAHWPVGESAMENKLDRPQSHEEREVQTLVKHIEKQVFKKPPETKRTFDDYRKVAA